jgi:penicillin-binding protein-related factor A (putative recombinase)
LVTNYGKRGMDFENVLEYTNNLYRTKGKALINKRATPMTIIRNAGPSMYVCMYVCFLRKARLIMTGHIRDARLSLRQSQ